MKLWGLLIGAVAIAGCGSADDKELFGQRVCVPGAAAECACPGGVKGAQACRDDGSGYEACQCGGGSGSGGSAGAGQSGSGGTGGSTGGSAGTGGSGTGGAGGSCTPRSMCPAPELDGGAPLCGMLDDYCGGRLSCGCAAESDCTGGACECWRIPEYDQACVTGGSQGHVATQCIKGRTKPAPCFNAVIGRMPNWSYCCS